jgi:TatD DNase family protein
MLTDSHAHIDDPRFDADRSAVLARAQDNGVSRILTIGNGRGPDDMGCGIPIAESVDWIYTTVGIHPHDAAKVTGRHYLLLEELAGHPKVLAIGETGLDYFYDNSPRAVQQTVFRNQLDVARRLNLPVVVHTRDADQDTERILREGGNDRGVLHCFTSTPAMAEFALEIGFLISFSGIVTFAKSQDLAEIARLVPADRILVETDCPYLAPVPHRGKRNEPAFAVDTARFLASLRNVSFDDFASQTSSNFERLFMPDRRKMNGFGGR